MEKILQQVKNNIYENNLIEDNDVIVLGVSGGPDSIFLLHALDVLKPIIKQEKGISYELHVAHVNHMIRKEAGLDQEVARQAAKKTNATFHLLETDVVKEAKRLKIGTEECGRNIRYDFFEQVRKTVNATKIAVAHNVGDNAETILLNVLRGAGIQGLSGIEFKNNNIIRPILNVAKEDIIEYLESKNIGYTIDKTNFENDYTRNKIRNDLIVKIQKEYNPNIINTLNRMSVINKLDEKIIENTVKEKYEELNVIKEKDKIVLDIRKFNKLELGIKYRIIRKILEELLGDLRHIEMIHVKDICRLLENNITNKQYILGNKYKVVIEKKNIAIFVALCKK